MSRFCFALALVDLTAASINDLAFSSSQPTLGDSLEVGDSLEGKELCYADSKKGMVFKFGKDTMDVKSKGRKSSHCTVKYNVKPQDDGEAHLDFDSNGCMSDVKNIHIHSGYKKLSVSYEDGGSHIFRPDGKDTNMCCVCDNCRGGNCNFDCGEYDSPPRRRSGGGHRRRRVDPADDPKKCPCNNKLDDSVEDTESTVIEELV